ncbi:5882_t:CDS:2, partial [Racocetra fulgida]
GGVTIWKLQQLLASDLFPAYHEPHPDMVRSLTAVSSPFKGYNNINIYHLQLNQLTLSNMNLEKEAPNWYENDGLCPTISQMHPGGFECNDGMCKHHKGFPNLIADIREHENHKQSNEIFKDIEEIDDEIIENSLKYEPGKWDCGE